MRRLTFLVVMFVCLGHHFAMGNVPASYFACDGSSDGHGCRMVGPFFGRCTVDTLCEDDEEDPSLININECLLCVDECWSRPLGENCIITRSGQRGVCTAIPNCTPDDEKSFLVCQRCTSGVVNRIAPVDGCDQALGSARWIIYGTVIVLLWLNLRRRPT